MINKNEIRLTLVKRGRRQLRHGKYSSAVIEKVSLKGKGKSFNKITPIKTLVEPVEEEAIQILVLGDAFLQNSLEKPAGQYRRSGKKYWKKLPPKVKLKLHLEDLAHDLDAKVKSFEILN